MKILEKLSHPVTFARKIPGSVVYKIFAILQLLSEKMIVLKLEIITSVPNWLIQNEYYIREGKSFYLLGAMFPLVQIAFICIKLNKFPLIK